MRIFIYVVGLGNPWVGPEGFLGACKVIKVPGGYHNGGLHGPLPTFQLKLRAAKTNEAETSRTKIHACIYRYMAIYIYIYI